MVYIPDVINLGDETNEIHCMPEIWIQCNCIFYNSINCIFGVTLW